HCPAVPLDDRPHLLVVAPHQPPQGVGGDALAERRGADDVAKEDRDDLAHFACDRSLCKRGAAGAAEAKPRRILGTAARTSNHARSASRRRIASASGTTPLRSKNSI